MAKAKSATKKVRAKSKARRKVRPAGPLTRQTVMAFAATAQPKRARVFYEETLGLKLLSADEFALAFDANGIMLRVQIVERVAPSGYTTLGWSVPDLAKTARAWATARVTFER